MDIDIEHIHPFFPDGYKKLAESLIQMLAVPALLAIGGPRGTGKTALASGLVILFCELWRPSAYITVGEYFQRLSAVPWERKVEFRQRYERLHLLVLDEVQVRDQDRQWQDNELTTLIDVRHRNGLSTILISNLTPEMLKENLGESIWRRLIETGGFPIEANWERIAEVIARHRASLVAKEKNA